MYFLSSRSERVKLVLVAGSEIEIKNVTDPGLACRIYSNKYAALIKFSVIRVWHLFKTQLISHKQVEEEQNDSSIR